MKRKQYKTPRRKGVYLAAVGKGDRVHKPETEVERITFDLLRTDVDMIPMEFRKSILK